MKYLLEIALGLCQVIFFGLFHDLVFMLALRMFSVRRDVGWGIFLDFTFTYFVFTVFLSVLFRSFSVKRNKWSTIAFAAYFAWMLTYIPFTIFPYRSFFLLMAVFVSFFFPIVLWNMFIFKRS